MGIAGKILSVQNLLDPAAVAVRCTSCEPELCPDPVARIQVYQNSGAIFSLDIEGQQSTVTAFLPELIVPDPCRTAALAIVRAAVLANLFQWQDASSWSTLGDE